MIKRYRLSIEITRDIDESFQGIENKEERFCTREIVKCLLANPDLLTMYYKSIEAQHWIIDSMDDPECHRVLEEYDQIWEKLLEKVPPAVVDYFKVLIDYLRSSENVDNSSDLDARWELIFDSLNNGAVTGWDFEEMGIDEKLTPHWSSGNNLNQNQGGK
ncbi:MAG: hypothetical protein JSV88_05415 [Candidatus Aminicenantes bacterium]|nr:MAG: hypothetical protein JSV88_05415 [Candidatus Aminicenantes bacterium]